MKPQEKVMLNSDLWRILKIDTNGECTIRRFNQKGTKGGQIKKVHINELKAPLNKQ